MTSTGLTAKRVLITQADAFMGPALCEVFSEHGAVVVADARPLLDPDLPAAVIASAGQIDVLIVNLAGRHYSPDPPGERMKTAEISRYSPRHRINIGESPPQPLKTG